VDYTDYPRGRVLLDSMEEVFLVYSSRAIISGPALRNLIITETAIGGDEIRGGLSLRKRGNFLARRGL